MRSRPRRPLRTEPSSRSPGRGMPAPLGTSTAFRTSTARCAQTRAATSGRTTTCSGSTSPSRSTTSRGPMVYGPAAGTTLFPNSSVCGTRNGGDPVILYDQFANRWFATQSAYANLVDGPYYQCVAVSRTSDPTGAWCSYQFLSHTNEVHGLCEVRRMAEPERLHDDLAAVLPRGQLLGHRRLGARAEPAPLVRQRADRVSRHGLAGS